ncbi:MAG: sulfurtransferase [Chloroflexi bacterium]|nr:sulfurtransferase [Chloroflexota bacterium]
MVVRTDWVAEHLHDRNVRVVEVDVDTTAYDSGHIPGAVGWNWKTQLSDQVERDITPRENLERLLGSSGIDKQSTIVLYGDNNNWFAAWAFWQLKMYGHQDVRLMDGGRKKWVEEGRSLIRDLPSYPAVQYRAVDPDFRFRAFRDQVLAAVRNPQYAFVDVRSPREFSGELLAPEGLPQEGAQRGGHVPGAANIPWSMAVREDGTFKSVDELRQLYQSRGITPDKEIIAYCRIGERSSHTWFVLRYLLGYSRVRNYDGSWTEYGSLVDVPIEKGGA